MHDLPAAPTGRYTIAIEIMQRMHWGWAQLLEAPADLVEEIAFRMAQENKWTAKRRKLDAEMSA